MLVPESQLWLIPKWGLGRVAGYLGATVLLSPRTTPGSGCGPSLWEGHRLPSMSWPRPRNSHADCVMAGSG